MSLSTAIPPSLWGDAYRQRDKVRPFFSGLEVSTGSDMAAAENSGDAVEQSKVGSETGGDAVQQREGGVKPSRRDGSGTCCLCVNGLGRQAPVNGLKRVATGPNWKNQAQIQKK